MLHIYRLPILMHSENTILLFWLLYCEREKKRLKLPLGKNISMTYIFCSVHSFRIRRTPTARSIFFKRLIFDPFRMFFFLPLLNSQQQSREEKKKTLHIHKFVIFLFFTVSI